MVIPAIAANLRFQIDDAFIRMWDPRYKEKDEGDYEEVKQLVSADLKATGTISLTTFRRIWHWKGADRVIRHVRLSEYEALYAPAFRRAASAPPERKLAELIGPNVKLPGVGAPTGSTIIHFFHPETMPIIDVRTVEVLHAAGLISTKQRDFEHYEEFRNAIEGISRRCPGLKLRQIDRALFAYHKEVMTQKRKRGSCSPH